MCGPALVGRAAPAAAPPPTDSEHDLLASEALLGLAGVAYDGLDDTFAPGPAVGPAELRSDEHAQPHQQDPPRSDLPHQQDSERFFCPFPGCKRSFAELWRLKVHYRAPPNVRGSGKERGHGTRLTHCPKCNTPLKIGGHHVKCPGVRASSQRSNAAANAAKRQRRNSAAHAAAPAAAQRLHHHHHQQQQQTDAVMHGAAHFAAAGAAATAAAGAPPGHHKQQAAPVLSRHLLAPQHAEQQRAPWAAASSGEGRQGGQQMRRHQHQQLAQQLLQATAQQQGGLDAGALHYRRQLSRLQQLLEKVDQDLDYCDSEQPVVYEQQLPGLYGAAEQGGGYGGGGYGGGNSQHWQLQAAADRLQPQQLSGPALALHQLLQRSHSSESSSNSSGATRSGSNSGDAGGSRLTVPGDSSDGGEAGQAPLSAASLLAMHQQGSDGSNVWQHMVFAALQQLLSGAGTVQQGGNSTAGSMATAGMAGHLASMHRSSVPAAAGFAHDMLAAHREAGGSGGSINMPQLPAPAPLALPQQPAQALDAGHAQAFAALQAMLCRTSNTVMAAGAAVGAGDTSAVAAAAVGAEAKVSNDELEPVAALRALSAAAAAAADAGAAAASGAAAHSAAVPGASVGSAALLRMLHDKCVALLEH